MRKRTRAGSSDLACPKSGVRSDVERTVLMEWRLSMESSLIEDLDNYRPANGAPPAVITAIDDEPAQNNTGQQTEKPVFIRRETPERRKEISKGHPGQCANKHEPEYTRKVPNIARLRHLDLHFISGRRTERIAHGKKTFRVFVPRTKRHGRAVAAGDPGLRLHPGHVFFDADDRGAIPHCPFSAGQWQ